MGKTDKNSIVEPLAEIKNNIKNGTLVGHLIPSFFEIKAKTEKKEKVYCYNSYKLDYSDENIIKSHTKEDIENIIKHISNNGIKYYDHEFEQECVIYKIDVQCVPNLDNIDFNCDNKKNYSNQKLNFYSNKIEYEEDKNLIILKKIYTENKNLKKSKRFLLSTDKLEEIEQNTININNEVDTFIYDGYMYVINKKNFIDIFKFDDFYRSKLRSNKKVFEDLNIFENVDKIEEICLSNKLLLKKAYKIISSDGIQIKDINQIKQIADDFKEELKKDLKFNDKNKLTIEDKDDVKNIFTIIEGKCVYTAETMERLIAMGFEN